MKKHHIIYLAGLFEGEGTCGCYKKRYYKGTYHYNLVAGICNTDKSLKFNY
jgi:hypothetical protein